MGTPIYDEVSANIKAAVAVGEFRGKIAGKAEILAQLKAIKRPSREIQAIIEQAEKAANGTR